MVGAPSQLGLIRQQAQTQSVFQLEAVAAGSDRLALGKGATIFLILTEFEIQQGFYACKFLAVPSVN